MNTWWINELILCGEETSMWKYFMSHLSGQDHSGAKKWRHFSQEGTWMFEKELKWGKHVTEREEMPAAWECCTYFLLSWEDPAEEQAGPGGWTALLLRYQPSQKKLLQVCSWVTTSLPFHWDERPLGVSLSFPRISKKVTTQFAWDLSWLWSHECVFKSLLRHISNVWLRARYPISLNYNFLVCKAQSHEDNMYRLLSQVPGSEGVVAVMILGVVAAAMTRFKDSSALQLRKTHEGKSKLCVGNTLWLGGQAEGFWGPNYGKDEIWEL